MVVFGFIMDRIGDFEHRLEGEIDSYAAESKFNNDRLRELIAVLRMIVSGKDDPEKKGLSSKGREILTNCQQLTEDEDANKIKAFAKKKLSYLMHWQRLQEVTKGEFERLYEQNKEFFEEAVENEGLIDLLEKGLSINLCQKYKSEILNLLMNLHKREKIVKVVRSFEKWSGSSDAHRALLTQTILQDEKVGALLDEGVLTLPIIRVVGDKKWLLLYIASLVGIGVPQEQCAKYAGLLAGLLDQRVPKEEVVELLKKCEALGIPDGCNDSDINWVLGEPSFIDLIQRKVVPADYIMYLLKSEGVHSIEDFTRVKTFLGEIVLLMEEGVPFEVCKKYTWLLRDLLDKKCTREEIKMILTSHSPTTPPILSVNPKSLKPFQEKNFVKEKMEAAGALFASLNREEKENIATKISSLTKEEKSCEKLSTLASLVKREDGQIFFWEQPIFQDDSIHEYILLLFLMGLIPEEELNTLHTMVAEVKARQAKGIDFISIPLFLENVGINPVAWELLSSTKGLANEVVRHNWFCEMQERPSVECYYLYESKKKYWYSDERKNQAIFSPGMLETIYGGKEAHVPVHYGPSSGNGDRRVSLPVTFQESPENPVDFEALKTTNRELFRYFINRDVFDRFSSMFEDLAQKGVSGQELLQMIPATPTREKIPIDRSKVDLRGLEELQNPTILERKMKKAGHLFEFVEQEKISEIALHLSRVAAEGDAGEKISRLVKLVRSTEYQPNFWGDPLFAEKEIDAYIFLAHAMGLLSEGELATLHTMASSIAYYRALNFPVVSLPLFSKDGTIHPAALEMVKASLGMEDERKRREWFHRMKTQPLMEQYFLGIPNEEIQTVMKRIANDLEKNILYRPGLPGSSFHLVPTIAASFEMLKLVGGEYLPKPVYHYGLGIPLGMREEHKKDSRTVTLQTSFCPSPLEADAIYAPAAELTLHDLLFHFYIASFIPHSHMRFFMEWSEYVEKRLASVTNEKMLALLKYYINVAIDSEVRYRNARSIKDKLIEGSMQLRNDFCIIAGLLAAHDERKKGRVNIMPADSDPAVKALSIFIKNAFIEFINSYPEGNDEIPIAELRKKYIY